MSLVGGKILHRERLQSNSIEKCYELCIPVANRRVWNLDVKGCSQNKADVAKRIFNEVKHAQGRDKKVHRITYAFEIVFSKKRRHGWWHARQRCFG
ncbi:MAG: hypothetical protein GX783_07170 [Clostridiales bacterium]|nr:hypothetical protein [Clostridiales bacterium]